MVSKTLTAGIALAFAAAGVYAGANYPRYLPARLIQGSRAQIENVVEREFSLLIKDKSVFFSFGGIDANLELQYEGLLNTSGQLEIYVDGNITPLRLGETYKTDYGAAVTPLRFAADGEDANKILTVKVTGPKPIIFSNP